MNPVHHFDAALRAQKALRRLRAKQDAREGRMTPKAPKGFAIMTPAQVRAIASQGGKAAHAQHVAHEWTASEAAVAGQRGGRVTAAQRRARADALDAPGRADDTC